MLAQPAAGGWRASALSVLHRIGKETARRRGSVIFVHGLGGDAEATWRRGEDAAAGVNLPEYVLLDLRSYQRPEELGEDGLNELVSDQLSDRYDFCVTGFKIKVVEARMLQGIIDDLKWMVSVALMSMMAGSTHWENRAMACYQLDELRDERPDLI